MTIHTQKLAQFALYAAHADEFGVTVFGSCRDEALNNLAEELRLRQGYGGQVTARGGQVGEGSEPSRRPSETMAGEEGRRS